MGERNAEHKEASCTESKKVMDWMLVIMFVLVVLTIAFTGP